MNSGSCSQISSSCNCPIPDEFRQLSKRAFKKLFHDLLLSIMETENDYVEVPILLQKIAQSAARTSGCKTIFVTLGFLLLLLFFYNSHLFQ